MKRTLKFINNFLVSKGNIFLFNEILMHLRYNKGYKFPI